MSEKQTETKVEKKSIVKTSLVEYDDGFYEEIIGENGVQFCTMKDEKIEYADTIIMPDADYIPINDDAISTGAVLLPSGPADYENVESLLLEIRQFLHKYLDVSEDHELFVSYYIPLSWVYDRFTVLPYLRALGDTGTGKSRYLTVIGSLLYKPCIMAGAVTPAPLYRMLKRWGGSLVIDEGDFADKSETTEIVTKILNCGFESNKPVIRCVENNPDELQFLPTFGPKVIATRYSFKDKALESRCLTEKMRQTTRQDIPSVLPKSFYKESAELRDKLLKFRFDFRNKINPEIMQTVDLGDIEPRLKQGMSAFTVLFANIPEVFEQFKLYLQKYQAELIEERSTSFEGMIVTALYELTQIDKKEDFTPQDIAEKMNTLYNPQKVFDAKGIGKHLRSLGIESKKTRTGPTETKRLIIVNDYAFNSLFKRYGNVPSVPSVPSIYSPPKHGTVLSVPFSPGPRTDGTNGTDGTNDTNSLGSWISCPNCLAPFGFNGKLCTKCDYEVSIV